MSLLNKTPSANYTGPVSWVGKAWGAWPHGDMNGEGWFSSVRALVIACARAGIPLPPYAWAAVPRGLSINADDVVDLALNDHHEEAGDELEPGAKAALQGLLDTWIRAYGRKVKTWEEHTGHLVILGDEDLSLYAKTRAEMEADLGEEGLVT